MSKITEMLSNVSDEKIDIEDIGCPNEYTKEEMEKIFEDSDSFTEYISRLGWCTPYD